MNTFPDFSHEDPLWEKGFSVIGMDEVGRGAFAGPLCVGGVVFDQDNASEILKTGINDSKKLTPKKREELSPIIKKMASFWDVEYIAVEMISKIGIGKANLIAMKRLYDRARRNFSKNLFAITDTFTVPGTFDQRAILRGDSISISIAAASIIAKVERDNLMKNLSLKYPVYDWKKNKGYGTKFHRDAIKKHGMTAHHRKDFVRKYI